MPRLKDIPVGKLTPEEEEAVANDTFDYADRERVSLREASRKIMEDQRDKNRRASLAEVQKAFGTGSGADTRPISPYPYDITEGYGDFTFREKSAQIGKAVHRGLGAIVKIPGVGLKLLGELEPTRHEIAHPTKGDIIKREAFNHFMGLAPGSRSASYFDTTIGRAERKTMDGLRRAGNWYIAKINGLIMPESAESRAQRNRPFMEAPFYRTATAVGESAPSYAVAIAATVSTGNPNIGLWVLGTTTAAASYDNLRSMGVDPDLALIGAAVEGSIEMLTEKIPMDMLMTASARPLLLRALKIGTAESFQELFAQLGQNYVNAVIRDVDPDNLESITKAAHQEWSIIAEGWQDAMAAGFVMGGGAGAVVSGPNMGRTPVQMQQQYGFTPRNMNEFIALTETIRDQVRQVEPFEGVLEQAQAAGAGVSVTERLAQLQADADATKDARVQAMVEGGLSAEKATEVFDTMREIENQQVMTQEVPAEAPAVAPVAEPTPKGAVIPEPPAAAEKAVIPEPPERSKQIPMPGTNALIPAPEIGEGEEKVRGTTLSVMEKAIEKELLKENETLYDDLPTYQAMNMKEQAEKSLALIEQDVEKAKRIAFYREQAPPGLYPENVFSALRVYATLTGNVDMLMDLALNEETVREHTILGKRIKSLDTDQDHADPVTAIREVVTARKNNMLRKGQDMIALEAKLGELQAELDTAKRTLDTHIKKTKREYGSKNTIVSRAEYDSILARRKAEAAKMKHDPRLGAAFIPTATDFADIAKIGMFHLEAMGRDFAKWSYQMTKDFGDWITPHLQDEYDKAIKQAETQGLTVKEAKRLTTKKKRLVTTTKKIEGKIAEQDFAKIPRIPIELDEEGQRLQNAYDVAREKMKAAQAVANIITEREVQIIAQLAKDVAERKTIMQESPRRDNSIGEGATVTELKYGIAMSLFLEYVNELKSIANKKTARETVRKYLSNPVDFISDFAGTLKAAKASLDNSFHLRQGLPTFLKGITGHIPSAKIWWDTFIKSWKTMWGTLRKRPAMRGLFAEMVSDPDYPLLKQARIALNVIEEEIPVDIPSKIPVLGILFRMGENAFVGSSRYMRYQLAKQYLSVWRKSGIELSKRELRSIGALANSQTGRGETAAKSQTPGLLNNLFWSPRNLRAYIDILTLHLFNRDFTAFARRQAAINLLRYISGAAMILALAKWIDDDSVTWDSNNADFGKIRVGSSRFSVGGGMAVLIVLASRLVTREFTSSTTGKTESIDSRKFGALGGKDLIFNFVSNKLSPAAQLALSLVDQKTWDGNQLTIPQMVDDALTPLIIQNVIETGTEDDAANVLAALMAEALGVNVQTYPTRQSKAQRYKRKRKN